MARFVLVVESGATSGADIALEPGEIASVGRAEDARVRMSEDDKKVSRYHAVLDARGDGVFVRDLGSRNGTFVNDAQVREALARDGDRIRVGRTTMRVRAAATALAAPAATEDEDAPALPATAFTVPAAPVELPCNVCGAPYRARAASPWAGARPLCDRCVPARRAMATRAPDRAMVGGFEVVRFLAAGGMGAVYEARHADFGTHAAVKLLRSDSPLAPMFLRRFLKEQKVVLKLSHPNVVRAFEAAVDQRSGEPYIASELVTGGDAAVMASPSSNPRFVVGIVADLFDALAYGHALGILHRDVKPANLLLAVDASGKLRGKLNDYGLAKSFREAGGTSITAEGEAAGSALFMAPEQLLHFKTVGPSADVYGAAATLFFLLTARSPLKLPVPDAQATMPMACAATLDVARVSLRELRPDVASPIAELVDRLVARDPAARTAMEAAGAAAALRSA